MFEMHCKKCEKSVPTIQEVWNPSQEGQITVTKCYHCDTTLRMERDRSRKIKPRR